MIHNRSPRYTWSRISLKVTIIYTQHGICQHISGNDYIPYVYFIHHAVIRYDGDISTSLIFRRHWHLSTDICRRQRWDYSTSPTLIIVTDILTSLTFVDVEDDTCQRQRWHLPTSKMTFVNVKYDICQRQRWHLSTSEMTFVNVRDDICNVRDDISTSVIFVDVTDACRPHWHLSTSLTFLHHWHHWHLSTSLTPVDITDICRHHWHFRLYRLCRRHPHYRRHRQFSTRDQIPAFYR